MTPAESRCPRCDYYFATAPVHGVCPGCKRAIGAAVSRGPSGIAIAAGVVTLLLGALQVFGSIALAAIADELHSRVANVFVLIAASVGLWNIIMGGVTIARSVVGTLANVITQGFFFGLHLLSLVIGGDAGLRTFISLFMTMVAGGLAIAAYLELKNYGQKLPRAVTRG